MNFFLIKLSILSRKHSYKYFKMSLTSLKIGNNGLKATFDQKFVTTALNWSKKCCHFSFALPCLELLYNKTFSTMKETSSFMIEMTVQKLTVLYQFYWFSLNAEVFVIKVCVKNNYFLFQFSLVIKSRFVSSCIIKQDFNVLLISSIAGLWHQC